MWKFEKLWKIMRKYEKVLKSIKKYKKARDRNNSKVLKTIGKCLKPWAIEREY